MLQLFSAVWLPLPDHVDSNGTCAVGMEPCIDMPDAPMHLYLRFCRLEYFSVITNNNYNHIVCGTDTSAMVIHIEHQLEDDLHNLVTVV